MIPNILDLVQGRNLAVFDIETVQHGKFERPYSAALYSNGKVNEKFFGLPDKIINNAGYRSERFLERSDYFNKQKSPDWSDLNGRSLAMYSMLEDSVVNNQSVLVGHNIKFDINNGLSLLNKEHRGKFASAFGEDFSHLATLEPKILTVKLIPAEARKLMTITLVVGLEEKLKVVSRQLLTPEHLPRSLWQGQQNVRILM